MAPATRKRPRGRPREQGLDERILDAALAELAAQGFERMSIDAVVRKAGVTKPTLYRRWKCKADLATAALHRLQQSTFPAPTGDTREDITANLAEFMACLLRPNGMSMIGTLLVEERTQPRLIELFRKRIVNTRRAALRRMLEDAIARGELAPTADIDAALNCLIGAFYARYLTGEGFPRDWPRRVARVALDGLPWRRASH